MNNYIGKYQGIDIYGVTLEEYYNLTSAQQKSGEVIYLILDDHRVITKGQVFGRVTIDHKRLDVVGRPVAFDVAYGSFLAQKEKEMKARAEEKRKAAIISERATVESLAKQAENNLKAMKHAAANKAVELHHEAEVKLNEVVEKTEDAVQEVVETATEVATDMTAESKQMLDAVVAEGEAQVKPITTTRRKKKPVVVTE